MANTNIRISILVPVILAFCSCAQTSSDQHGHKDSGIVQSDLCDDPDADIACCFINVPANLTGVMSIAGENEQGDKMIITGTIYKADGVTPYPDVIMYCYHTDGKGYYSKSGKEKGVQKWHGRLHGWCKSDVNGKYEIHTIRPAAYPDGSLPAHIHAAVKTGDGKMHYINDFIFKDDSLVNEKYLSAIADMGGTGIVNLTKSTENTWLGTRDIILE